MLFWSAFFPHLDWIRRHRTLFTQWSTVLSFFAIEQAPWFDPIFWNMKWLSVWNRAILLRLRFHWTQANQVVIWMHQTNFLILSFPSYLFLLSLLFGLKHILSIFSLSKSWNFEAFFFLSMALLHKKIKYIINKFVSKCDQICIFLKKSLMEKSIFCAVQIQWRVF